MLTIKEIQVPDYEKVIEAIDNETGFHCFIAVHSTSLGPAMGGTRILPYPSAKDALEDALRLSKAMTYKSAIAENGLGGGKSVIIADSHTQKNKTLLYQFADVLNILEGKYIAAEDMGTTPEDMSIIRDKSPYVAAMQTERSSGDPSRFTAWGVYCGIQAVCKKLWNDPSVKKRTIAIQGLGNVGSKLANMLFWAGADLILCDKDPKVTHDQALLYGAEVVDIRDFHKTKCDILAPCAIGGGINADTIPELHCRAVAGAANNQLREISDAIKLKERGILYAPDYVINAGGIINAAGEFNPAGYDPKKARNKVNHIYDTLLEIFDRAEKENLSTQQVADKIAEDKLVHGIGRRHHPIPHLKK